MRQTGLTDLDWEVVMVYAENDMNAWQTARQLCLSSGGVAYHLDKVRDATGYDPRVFFDLADLMRITEAKKTITVTMEFPADTEMQAIEKAIYEIKGVVKNVQPVQEET